MATTIYFYTYTGDPKAVDKSGSLSTPATKTCKLTSPCDVSAPTVILTYSSTDLQGYNYAYIPDFGRYYFITARETDSAGQLRLQLQTDGLYTWAADISTWDLIISRSGQPPEGHSTYTRDPLLPLAADREITTYRFNDEDNPFNVSTATDTSYNYVLNVAGREQN